MSRELVPVLDESTDVALAQARIAKLAPAQRSGLDVFRSRPLAAAGVIAGLLLIREATVDTTPVYAQDAPGCVTTTTIESVSTLCTPAGEGDNGDDQGDTSDTSSGGSGSSNPKKPKKPKTHHHQKPAEHDTSDPFNPSLGGLNMGDQVFTDHNGCFITATTSAFRVLTGNASLTPERVYNQDDDPKHHDIKNLWTPGGGVKNGGDLFRALPAMAARLGIHMAKAGAKGVTKALRKHDDYTALVVFNSGYFAGPSGHYERVAKVLPNGNWVLDDPNGNGKHGDSERKGGWSPQTLLQRGAARFRILSLKKR